MNRGLTHRIFAHSLTSKFFLKLNSHPDAGPKGVKISGVESEGKKFLKFGRYGSYHRKQKSGR